MAAMTMAVRARGHVVFTPPPLTTTTTTLMLMQFHIDKHGIKPEIIDQPTNTRDDKGDPEFLLRRQKSRDRGPGHGRQRAHHARDAHDGGALLGPDDGGDEGRPRRLVHIVQSRAQQ